jgi:lipopolysaccharide transport system ATP-binding protein
LDEIIAFSGCERYIDTPTKRYSSGMTVRLAFAVAAFLEPEILVVDEVLAVGDAEFQKKAIGKMQDISKSEGRTVLFVSHNIGAIASFCTKGIYMINGKIISNDNILKIIDMYVDDNSNSDIYFCKKLGSNYISNVKIFNNGKKSNQFGFNDFIDVFIEIEIEINNLKAGVALLDRNKNKIFTSHFDLSGTTGKVSLKFQIPRKTICPGIYSFDVAIFNNQNQVYDYVSDICKISIIETGSNMFFDKNFGSVFINCKWDVL